MKPPTAAGYDLEQLERVRSCPRAWLRRQSIKHAHVQDRPWTHVQTQALSLADGLTLAQVPWGLDLYRAFRTSYT